MRTINRSGIVCMALTVLFLLTNIALAEGEWAKSGDHIYSTYSGNVGIGTTSPGSILHIDGTGQIRLSRSGDNTWRIFTTNTGSGGLAIRDETATEYRMFFAENGKVGIGTTSPNSALDVRQSNINEAIATFTSTYGGEHSAGIGVDGRGSNWGAALFQNGVIRFSVESNGGAIIGGGYMDSNAPANGAIIQGNVGIGTTSPSGKLHISGGAGTVARIHSSGTGYEEASLFITNSTGSAFNDGIEITHGAGVTRFNDLAGKTNLTINQSNGNVGIGTTSPSGKLHISGGAGTVVRIHSSGTGYEEASLFITNSTGSAFNDGIEITHGAGVTRFNDLAGKTNLTINQSNGNVGIGTHTPQSKLTVNGAIIAKEVEVTNTGWSDFVFEDTYELPTLSSVEFYIKKNKHLPDIPSAKEVEQQGLAVSEMLAKQMQKIEEMTLYLIQLKKENDRLKERVALLEETAISVVKK